MKSPHLEAFRDKEYEVLFMLDEIDDLIFGGFEYKGKNSSRFLRGDIHLGQDSRTKKKRKFGKLVDFIRTILRMT